MSHKYTKTTNGHVRELIHAEGVTLAEREQLDYVDWNACEEGTDSFLGFRYRGDLYDVHEFTGCYNMPDMEEFDGFTPHTAFSGLAIKLVRSDYGADCDGVIVTYLTW